MQCNGVTVREIVPEFPRWAVVAGLGGGTQGGNACGAPAGTPHVFPPCAQPPAPVACDVGQ